MYYNVPTKMSFIAITDLDNLIMSYLDVFDWSSVARVNRANYNAMCQNPHFREWDCINAAKERYVLRTQNKDPVDLWFDNMVLKNLPPRISDRAIETKCIMRDPLEILFYYACHFGSLYVAEFLMGKIKPNLGLFTDSLMVACRSNHFHIYEWLRAILGSIVTRHPAGARFLRVPEEFDAQTCIHVDKFEDTLYHLIIRHKNEQLEWFLEEASFRPFRLREYIIVAWGHNNECAFELLCCKVSADDLRFVVDHACIGRNKSLIIWLHKRNLIDISAGDYMTYRGSSREIRELLEQLYDIPKILPKNVNSYQKTYTYNGVLGTPAVKYETFRTKKEKHPRKTLTKHQSRPVARRFVR